MFICRLLVLVGFLRSSEARVLNRAAHTKACPEQEQHLSLSAIAVLDNISLQVVWPTGGHAELNAGWLRERCLAASSVQEGTNQPLQAYHELPPSAHTIKTARFALNEANLEGGWVLAVEFGDGHHSTFDVGMLERQLADPHDVLQPRHYQHVDRFSWGSELGAPPEADWAEVAAGGRRKLDFITSLLTVGIGVLTGVGRGDGQVVQVANNISLLRPTNWGNFFNVKTEADKQEGKALADLAYSSQSLPFHTDNPYRNHAPEFQLLHVLEQCVCDEEAPCPACPVLNFAVDGFHVATLLRQQDPEAFELLSTVNVRFENDGGDGDSAMIHHSPMIQLDAAGQLAAIAFSSKSGGYAPPMPAAKAKSYYAARAKFSELLHAPEHKIQFQLKPGQVWVFDNTRVLHARSSVTGGARHLQGAYMDRSQLWYNFELLRGQQARAIVAQELPKDATPEVYAEAPDRAYRRVPGGKATTLADLTWKEVDVMNKKYEAHEAQNLASNLLGMLEAQRGIDLGQGVDLYDHNLQTATRAFRGGEDEELVVVSLLHDIAETIAAANHGAVVAELLQPWISPQAQWMLRHHAVFQLKYYGHHVGADPDTREVFAGHPFYNATARWCGLYDQASFDPAYPNLPLSFFRPMLKRLLDTKPFWWREGPSSASPFV